VKRKINILEISSRSDIGGGPEQLFNIVSNLKDSFRFFCACPDQQPYYEKIVSHRIPVFKLPHRRFELKSFFKLLRWTKVNKISVVHSHGRGAGIYARLLMIFNRKVKIVHNFHGIHFSIMTFTWVAERLLRLLTNKFVFVSESEMQTALKYRLTSISKCVLIENGILLDNKEFLEDKQSGEGGVLRNKNGELFMSKYYPNAELIPRDIVNRSIVHEISRRVLRIPGKINFPDGCIIGMLSRFDKVKNIPYAIRALSDYLKNHNDVFLVIGGDGEERLVIERTIRQYNLLDKVILLGYVYDTQQFFRCVDVYLNTSVGEAFGLSTVEAMKFGKPVVVSRVSGNMDIVKDNNTGLVFQLEKPSMVIEKIEILRSDKELCERLSRNALETVKKRFDLCRMLRKTKDLYSSLVPYLGVSEGIRVGINASKYFGINTGVGRYTSNLCNTISKGKDGNDYYFYLPGRSRTCWVNMDEVQPKEQGFFLQNNTMRILWEQIFLPIKVKKDMLDLFHYTDHAMSLVQRRYPVVITVHDIAYIRFPDLLNKSRQVYKKYILNLSVKKADIIIADSYSTKRDIIEFFKVDKKKIKVIHLGVESRFHPISNVEGYRIRNNLPSKMVLNIGTLEPRKNVVALIKAFKKLQKKGYKDYVLVIAGERGWLYKRIFEEIKTSSMEQSIRLLGVVRDEEMPMLYNCAELFVYPSLYEGFGLPPLEAMACGVPIITSNTSSLPEVVGNAGIMVDPNDIESLSDEMCRVLKDNELKHRMSRDGLKRSKMFTWEKTVNKVLETYNEVLS
jgi:glycosyltransferase involved in cell wall biosynthesis